MAAPEAEKNEEEAEKNEKQAAVTEEGTAAEGTDAEIRS